MAHWLLSLVAWARQAGPAGAAVYGLGYVLGTLLFVPGSVLTLLAGFLYGLAGGLAVVVPSSLLGALLAFLLGRTVARAPVLRLIQRHRRFRAVDQAISAEAFRVVLLLRLSPVFPFNLLNYGLGVTGVSLRTYLLGTALGVLPGAVLYVYLGSLLTTATEALAGRPSAGWAGRLLFAAGLVATAAVVVLVSRAARRALEAKLGEEAPGAGPPSSGG